MQPCGFHCIIWYSICILVIIPIYFINFNALLCGLQWVPVVKKYQMGSDINPFPARGFVNSISSSTTCFYVTEELFDGIA